VQHQVLVISHTTMKLPSSICKSLFRWPACSLHWLPLPQADTSWWVAPSSCECAHSLLTGKPYAATTTRQPTTTAAAGQGCPAGTTTVLEHVL
jgi:hypothetical protein